MLKLEDYLRYPHVLLAHAGDLSGVVDRTLEQKKRRRRVLATTPYAVSLKWYARSRGDAGLLWMRELLKRLAPERAAS